MYLYDMKLLYRVWSPHLWFSLITLSMKYPKYPSDIIKKQYNICQHNNIKTNCIQCQNNFIESILN